MCCCGKPTVNGEPGYSWDGKTIGAYPPNPPSLDDGDILIHDEPGRCGGIDSHSHHFRVVIGRQGGFALLVRHGGGDERIDLGQRHGVNALMQLDSNARYWLLQCLYHVLSDSMRTAANERETLWRKAAAEKRIKTRKTRGGVRVWIAERLSSAAGAVEHDAYRHEDM
jgi:hypothetical protein